MSYVGGNGEIVCFWLVDLIPIQEFPRLWSRPLWKLWCESCFDFFFFYSRMCGDGLLLFLYT